MAMTDEQRLSYEANGFLMIRQALSSEELKTVQAAAKRAEERWRADTSLPGDRRPALDQVMSPIEYDDALLNLLWHPTVFPIVHEIMGDNVQMIDNDYFITPANSPHTHSGWHHDVGMPGIYHPRSTVMAKVFYLLNDVNADSGGTAIIPGSHRFPMDFVLPQGDPRATPGAVQITGKAGDAYFFNGRCYHAAVNNSSDHPRHVLIYNYGHRWMKVWDGYEASPAVQAKATTQMQKQLLSMTGAYVREY